MYAMPPSFIPALLLSVAFPVVVFQTLPVFAVKSSFPVKSRTQELFKGLYDDAGFPTYHASSIVLHASDNSSTIENDTLSGEFWTADNTRLWNTSLAKKKVEHFEKLKRSCKISADRLVQQYNLLPTAEEDSPFGSEFAGTSRTRLSRGNGLANSNDFKREDL